MSGEERALLNLMDSYWFGYGVFTAKESHLKTIPVVDHQMQEDRHEDEDEDEDEQRSKLHRTPTLMRKSYSDDFLSSKDDSSGISPSPTSVLLCAAPQLQTILSGKQVDSFQDRQAHQDTTSLDVGTTDNSCIYLPHTHEFRAEAAKIRNRLQMRMTINTRRKSGWSRSLSELELEELKGFMDLGFVFTTTDDDQNMDSRLVSIIPGLQRLGKNEDESSAVSRPYLSEAWDDPSNPSTMNWRIPSFGNEMELKHHLRFWAHTVAASTVGS